MSLIHMSNQYTMVGQIDVADEHADIELGHRHHDNPVPYPIASMSNEPNHTHCSECDRQRERRERRESDRKSCDTVARTFILIALFLMILGIVGVKAWKEVCLKSKNH